MARLRNVSDDELHLPEFGQTVGPDGILEVSDALWAQREWPASVWAEVEVPRKVFNPADHTVSEVNKYLDRADDDERARVLAAERDGQARKGILGDNEG